MLFKKNLLKRNEHFSEVERGTLLISEKGCIFVTHELIKMLALVFRKHFGRSQLLNLHYPLLRLNFDFIDLSAKLKIDFAYSEQKLLQRTH